MEREISKREGQRSSWREKKNKWRKISTKVLRKISQRSKLKSLRLSMILRGNLII